MLEFIQNGETVWTVYQWWHRKRGKIQTFHFGFNIFKIIPAWWYVSESLGNVWVCCCCCCLWWNYKTRGTISSNAMVSVAASLNDSPADSPRRKLQGRQTACKMVATGVWCFRQVGLPHLALQIPVNCISKLSCCWMHPLSPYLHSWSHHGVPGLCKSGHKPQASLMIKMGMPSFANCDPNPLSSTVQSVFTFTYHKEAAGTSLPPFAISLSDYIHTQPITGCFPSSRGPGSWSVVWD